MYSYGSYYPSSYYNSRIAAGAAGAIFAGVGLILLFVLALYVILIIAQWKMFTKAGEDGWKSLIPIYNMVILYKIAGVCPWLVLVNLAGAIPVVGSFIIIGMSIYLNYKLSKAFGKDGAFTVGLILLPFIFYLILAFDKTPYVGPKYVSNGASQQPYNGNMNNQQQYNGNMNNQQQYNGNMNNQQQYNGNMNNQPQYNGNMDNQPQYNGNMNNQPQYNGNMNNQAQYNNNMNNQPQFNGNMDNQMPNNNMNAQVPDNNMNNSATYSDPNNNSNNNTNV